MAGFSGSSYKIDGVQYPRVSSILGILGKGDALTQWAANCAIQFVQENSDLLVKNNVLDIQQLHSVLDQARFNWKTVKAEACDIGTEAHDLIEKYIVHGKDVIKDVSDEVMSAMCAFWDWEKETGVKWIKIENLTWHPKLFYAGTFDAIADMDGKRYLIDFKTSKGIYKEYTTQVSAYRLAEEARGNQHGINATGILRIDKITGVPEFKDVSKDYEKEANAFRLLVHYYYASAKRRVANPMARKYHS